MKELQEIAEVLENKKLTLLRLNLSGFVIGGLFRLIQAYVLSSDTYMILTILQIAGGLIWLISIQQLLAIERKVNNDKGLKQLFNDELVVQNKLKAWKAGFFAVLIVQVILVLISFFQGYDGGLAAELSIYVAISVVLISYIVQEELLAITLFQMDIDEEKYEIWNWKKLSYFHWVINPGLAVNELIMGQRLPQIVLIDKQSPRPLAERSYVPCPSCETLHNGIVWSAQNKTAFKNWYGLYCPSCGEVIPCLRNVFSWMLIVITYPLWFWKKEVWKAKWLEKQSKRFENYNVDFAKVGKFAWLKIGSLFGAAFFVTMTVTLKTITLFFEDVEGDYLAHYLDKDFLLLNAGLCYLTGIALGLFSRHYLGKKGNGIDTQVENEVA